MSKKIPAEAGIFLVSGIRQQLNRLDVRSLLAFRTRGHVELDALVFLQRLEAARLNCREVREQIFAAFVRGDETETFGVVEPFNSTCCHCISYLSKLCGIARVIIVSTK